MTVIKPVLHRILVKPFEIEEYDPVYAAAEKAGIKIAKTEENKYARTQVDQGIVISLGDNAFLDYVVKYNKDIPVRVGDVVTYARHSGRWVVDPNSKEDFVVINDDDVICSYNAVKEE